jgi:hypothetical protein
MIRNIVYLDIEKMYSMSSQIFEGITEYVVSRREQSKEESEGQKGPVGSGRVLGDIIRNNEIHSEGRVLNDYSFSLFEKRLIEDGMVQDLTTSENNDTFPDLQANRFVKVSALVTFNDMRSIRGTISNFNNFGKSLTCVTTFSELTNLRSAAAKLGNSKEEIIEKRKLDAKIRDFSNLDAMQKKIGLYNDPIFLAELASTLEYGYQEQFEVQLNYGKNIFSANLKRESLRESEDLLIKKYSRKTEVKFVLFGVITQVGENLNEDKVVPENPQLKEALMGMVDMITNIESTFTGRLVNEVVIDPIALYTELN